MTKRWIVIFTFFFLVAAAAPESDVASRIAAETQKLVDANQFSGTLLVAQHGKPILERAWGLADVDLKAPNTLDTKFNIGSINKFFTKTAIAQLAERGKLSLDDTVRKHLPDYPSAVADRITIRQLIDHRSGLGDIFGSRYQAAPPSRLLELRDFLTLFADQPLVFEPGTSQRYSNAGYIVLGLIIERITGEKYRDYVAKNIFAPARMKDTCFCAVGEKVVNRATGYTSRDGNGERHPNDASLPGRPSSAGGAFATARDLLRFVNALEANKLTSQKWTNWIFSDSFDEKGPRGLGIAGGAPGVNASIEMTNGWTVIAMSNLDPPSARNVSAKAIEIVTGRKAEAADGGHMIRRGPEAPEKTEMSAPVAVPLTRSQHLLVVEAMVNGHGPLRFEIDSGAAGTMRISPEVANRLSLAHVGEALAGDPSGKNMDRRPVVRIDSIEIGGARFSGVDALVGPQRSADGVIGLRLFANLSATLDYQKPELRLSRESLPADGPHVLSFRTPHGIPVINVTVAGRPAEVDVDSGSPTLLTVPAVMAKDVPFKGELQVVGHGRTTTNEFDIRGAELNGDVTVAGYTVSAPRVDVVDIFPSASVGSRFLRDYVVTFDMPNSRIRLEK